VGRPIAGRPVVVRRAGAGALTAAALVLAFTMFGKPAAARPGPPPRVFAFVSHARGAELDHLRRYGSRISVIAPNWYELRLADESLAGAPSQPVIALTRAAGAQLWPVVNARLGPGGLRSSGRIVTAIAAEAALHGYDGITLDIEQLGPGQAGAYDAFVGAVAARLHAQHERLAVYVPRRTADGGDRDYDWKGLASTSDLLIASGYDEHAASGPPGPVTTRAGFAQMLDYAADISHTSVAPTIGAFGYSWPARGGGGGQLISSIDADRWRHQSGSVAHVVGGELTFRAGGRVVYYENAGALQVRARAARAHAMRWLALFSLGREPNSFWTHIRTARQVR
jgi:spore germination protein YaaH